ncbi:MAG: RNA pseudouridine synthase [Alkalibacterium sp.]|nr:RNA pseudouridine synthase [Alkalibacterium sp.]
MYSNLEDNGGKHAVTHYRKVLGNENYSLLEVELETGRKHQIRVHLKEMGHPVAGDKLYDAETNPLKRLGLHATTLVFVHPGTEQTGPLHCRSPERFPQASEVKANQLRLN